MPFFGEIIALLTAVCWSGSSYAFAAAVERVGSLQVNVNRMILAAIFLFIAIVVLDFDYTLSQKQILFLTISGIIGLVIGDSFLFKSYQYIGARLGMLLMSLAPGISALFAYLMLDETLSLYAILGIAVTLAGVAIVVFEKHEIPDVKYKTSPVGIFYGIMGAAGQAIGLVFAKLAFVEGHINGFVATFVRISTSAILILLIAVLARRYKNPVKLYLNDLRAFGGTLLGTIFGPFFGITFSLIAVENTKVGIAATLMSTMPILMLPISKYMFKEKFTWRAISGAVVAVAGIAILFLR